MRATGRTSCLEFFGRLANELINNQVGIRLTRAVADQDAGEIDAAATWHLRSGGQFFACRGARGIITFREGAEARTARSILPTSAARAHTPPALPVLVLQPHEGGGEQVLCKACHQGTCRQGTRGGQLG